MKSEELTVNFVGSLGCGLVSTCTLRLCGSCAQVGRLVGVVGVVSVVGMASMASMASMATVYAVSVVTLRSGITLERCHVGIIIWLIR